MRLSNVWLALLFELLLHARRPLASVKTTDEVGGGLLVLASALQEILVLP